MGSDKMREIIEKLKKQNSQPKVEEKKEVVKEEDDAELIEEDDEEQPKKEIIKETKPSEEETRIKAISGRIQELQNDGIYRLNLLIEMAELNNTLRILTATIMKIGGIENQTDEVAKNLEK